MTSQNATLATLLRGAQWRLDETAFDIGAGRCSRQQYLTLADGLAHLAQALREHAEDVPVEVDAPSE